MQRQSLGSSSSSASSPSSSKLHHHHHLHGIILNGDISLSPLTNSPKHKSSPPSSSPSSPTTTTTTTKSPHRFSPTTPSSSSSINAEKLIHLIPVFTLLCFLLLFLLSHNPSPSDLAQFKGLKVKTMQSIKTDVGELEGIKSTLIEQAEMNSVVLVGVEKADLLGIRSFRNLQETEEKYRYLKINNRKLGDF